MPVVGNDVRESPGDRLRAQTAVNEWIRVDVRLVIEIHELMSERLAKNDPDRASQRNRNGDDFPNRCCAVGHFGMDRFFIGIGQNKHDDLFDLGNLFGSRKQLK